VTLAVCPVVLSWKVTTPDSGRVGLAFVSKVPSTTHWASPPLLVRPPRPVPAVAVPLVPDAAETLWLITAVGALPLLVVAVAAHPVTASAAIASPAASCRIFPPASRFNVAQGLDAEKALPVPPICRRG
jgi:hypothetical protein